MNQDLAIVLALLGVAVVMFLLNWPRMDVVALIMMTALPLTGVITVGRRLRGRAARIYRTGSPNTASPGANTGCASGGAPGWPVGC